jgi:hypothetical protein
MPHKWIGTLARAMNRSMPPRAMSGASERSDLLMEAGAPGGPAVARGVEEDTTVSFGSWRVCAGSGFSLRKSV